MAAGDPDDIFNEIHYKFSYLSQLAERIDKEIQECHQKGVAILIELVRTDKTEHEDVKNRLRGFLEVFCSPKEIAGNLEVFQLEREVYSVMRTKPKDDVEVLRTVLEGLIEEEDGIFQNMKDLVAHFDAARIPKNAAEVAEESEKREERLKDIATSLQRFSLGKAEQRTIKRMIKKFAKAKKLRLQSEGSTIDGDNQSLEGEEAAKTLRDVLVEMYGFHPSMVNKIMRIVENRKMMNKASKNQLKGIKLESKMEELEDFAVLAVLKTEGSGALDWEIVETLREKFEALKKEILDEVEGIPDMGSEGKPKCHHCHGLFHEKLEILKVVKGWVFNLECNCSQLIQKLNAMMLGCEAAAAKFQEFKSAMANLRNYHHGLVPITVYKVLAMQGLGGENLKAGLVPIDKPESSSARADMRLLCEEIEFDRVIDLLQEIILLFRFALITSGLPNEEAVHNMESEVLFSYENALMQSEEALKDIERKMNRPRSKLEELPGGKGKRISESAYISLHDVLNHGVSD